MTQCERLSDRIPNVALGRSAWSAEEQAHLDACPDCRAEWDLVTLTARLGASLPPVSSAEEMTSALLRRLEAERAAFRSRRRNWLVVGLAAAAAILIAVGLPRSPSGVQAPAIPSSPGPVVATPTTPSPAVAAAGPEVALPELDGLPDAELESILGSLDQSSVVPSVDGPGFDNPDDYELERVLDAWEG